MKRFVFATICILGGLFLSSVVLALTVSPVKFEIFGDPGKILKGEISLMNEYKETKTFYSSVENFEATGETGTPTFTLAEEGLATWIEVPSQITLKPEEKKTIPFTIKIPQNADPGGHFAAIFWGTSPPQVKEGGQVSIAAKVGILVLLRVTGEIEEGGGILEFSTKNKQKVFNSLLINFVYRFQNGGDDRIKPSGEITIKNIFGGTSAVLPANKSEGNVLPQSIRKFEVEWSSDQTQITEKGGFFEELKREKTNFAFGRYTAQLNLEYGTAKEEAQASFGFFIIPWRILILAILILAIVALVLTKGIKKYNQWIIAKAKAR